MAIELVEPLFGPLADFLGQQAQNKHGFSTLGNAYFKIRISAKYA